MLECRYAEDVPQHPHYAVILLGNGYPVHYFAFDDTDEWEQYTKEAYKKDRDFIAIHVDGIARISTTIHIDITFPEGSKSQWKHQPG